MKLLTITTSVSELQRLVPTLRDLYFSCQVDGLSLGTSVAEAKLASNPWVHRRLQEYTVQPVAEDARLEAKELQGAARRAVLEEQPDVVLLPLGSSLEGPLGPCLREAGIGCLMVDDSKPAGSLKNLLGELRNRHLSSQPRPSKGHDPKLLMEEHWERLGQRLTSAPADAPILLLGQQTLIKECRARFPEREFHDKPSLERYRLGVSLFALSFVDQPEDILQTLRSRCAETLMLEPVNTQMVGARYTLRYGDYDNEFAFLEAEVDLEETLGQDHSTEVWSRRTGRAGDKPLPHPDGYHPVFATELVKRTECWSAKYALPPGKKLKIVLADSGNVAGSVLHHAAAINAFTDSESWAITLAPHPFICPQVDKSHTFFLQNSPPEGPSPELQKVLEDADCFIFFEDDDEYSESWPFPLHEYVADKPVLHLYIGYRVHGRAPRLQHPGRRILTPLPHILRMYPQARFYAGFPPLELLSIPLRPPLSQEDGICRILHTPSLPHWTTARYPYHKDNEAFLHAARCLKKRYGSKVEIHQVGGWSQRDVLLARQVCDVTFNQLRGFHGLSGDEAMFLERPCVQAFDRSNINRHREYWGLEADFPWVTASRENLEEVLAKLVENPAERLRIGEASRLFMLKYFSPQKGILPLLYHCYHVIRSREEEAFGRQ